LRNTRKVFWLKSEEETKKEKQARKKNKRRKISKIWMSLKKYLNSHVTLSRENKEASKYVLRRTNCFEVRNLKRFE
jgi:hypothetical protein